MKVDLNSEVYKNIDNSIKSFAQDKNIGVDYKVFHENISWELVRITQIFKQIKGYLKTRKPISILEIGIGYGIVTTGLFSCFRKEDITIHAIEHPGRIYLRSEKYMNHLKKTLVNLIEFDILKNKWPYNSAMFDVVIFSETLEHIPPTKVPFVFEEISRILRLNGILICTSPNLGGWRIRWKMMRGKSPFDPAIPLDWAPDTFAHIRLYTIKELIYLCKIHELKMEDVKYMDFGMLKKRGFRSVLAKIIYGMFPGISPNFVFMARKGMGDP